MNYAIIRHAKIKTVGNLTASLEHTFRTRPTPNADFSRRSENEHAGAKSPAEVVELFGQAWPEKLRKNGVIALEYICTTSPEWWLAATENDRREFMARSKAWLEERHGAKNVLYTCIHRDETTPHLVAFVVPKDAKGRMNAAHFVDGRKKLSLYQTSFAEKMQDLGLRRGMEGSKAKHERVKRYYGWMHEADQREMDLGPLDIASLAIGRPTKTAQKAEEAAEAAFTRQLLLQDREKALAARETVIARRERDAYVKELELRDREARLKVELGRDPVAEAEARMVSAMTRERELAGEVKSLRAEITKRSAAESEWRREKATLLAKNAVLAERLAKPKTPGRDGPGF